ncbi:hypothetical protein NVP1208B_49 [Vibrio phage 1.208.B._10N.222.52.A7]|nr:hypothetical protein NVP1208B_49 [Vibrio phage 1.208.B._10N.222.52.A7]
MSAVDITYKPNMLVRFKDIRRVGVIVRCPNRYTTTFEVWYYISSGMKIARYTSITNLEPYITIDHTWDDDIPF